MCQPDEDQPSAQARTPAEDALREFQLVLLESQRQAGMGSYVLDATTGMWTSSPALDELFGITDPAYTKDVRGWLRIVHPDDRERMLQYLSDHVLAQRRAFDTEYRIVRLCDHAERWVLGRGRLALDGGNRPIRMIGTIQDITERRRAEQERLALQRQMEQTQRLESLGVLAGGIAHDFNNLLMVVLGYTRIRGHRPLCGQETVRISAKALQYGEPAGALSPARVSPGLCRLHARAIRFTAYGRRDPTETENVAGRRESHGTHQRARRS